MSLKTIADRFEQFADEVWDAIQEEGDELFDKVVEEAKEVAEKVAESAGDVLEATADGLEDLVEKIGGAASRFVTDLMKDDTLSGLEKANLATVQLVEEAAKQGISLAAHDATFMIKSAYTASKDKLNQIAKDALK